MEASPNRSKLSSSTNSFSNSGMDISQNLMSVEDKHYSVVDEKDTCDVKSELDMPNTIEKLIANESQVIMVEPVSRSGSLLSTIGSSMNAEEKETEENLVEYTVQKKSGNKNTNANALSQDEYDASIDERLPETVTLFTTPDGGKLYLVGTAHFSVESQNDVSMIIQAVQPHVVAIELCRARVGILQLTEEVLYGHAKSLRFQTISKCVKQYGAYSGLLYVLLLRMVAKLTKELGMAPGGEFRRAFEEAKKVPNCIIQLADRPIDITIQRAVRSLSLWQTLRFGWDLMHLKDISKEDVEAYKQRDMWDTLINEVKEEFPPIERVFIKERDLYLAHSFQVAFNSTDVKPARVVAIVGAGHTPGIVANLGKVKPSDIPPIMRVPPQPLSTKILKFTVKVSLLSAIVYAGYKILPLPSAITLQSIRSSVEGLLKVSGNK